MSNFPFTFHFHALEKEMATQSSVLIWGIPGTGEPGGLPSMGSHRVGHDWSDLAAAAAARGVRTFKRGIQATQGSPAGGCLGSNTPSPLFSASDLLPVSPIEWSQLKARGQGSLVMLLWKVILPGHRAGLGRWIWRAKWKTYYIGVLWTLNGEAWLCLERLHIRMTELDM